MRQMTLAHQGEFQPYEKKTRLEQFLEEMDAVMPWPELLGLIEPHYPKGAMGRKPVRLNTMLRVYFLQQWIALSDSVWMKARSATTGPRQRSEGGRSGCSASSSACSD